MKYRISKFGRGLHICVKKSDGFREGDFVEIHRPNESEGMTEKKIREIVNDEIDKIRGNY